MALTTKEIAAAREAGNELGPRMVQARYRRTSARLDIQFDNGVVLGVPVALIQEFSLLDTPPSTADLSNIEIWGDGYDLHFPRIGIFLSGTALLAGILGTKAWMVMLARNLGATRSQAKAAASRENGKKGGRPRKAATVAIETKPAGRRGRAVSEAGSGVALGQQV